MRSRTRIVDGPFPFPSFVRSFVRLRKGYTYQTVDQLEMRRRRKGRREKPIVWTPMASGIKPPTYLPIETWWFRVFDSLLWLREFFKAAAADWGWWWWGWGGNQQPCRRCHVLSPHPVSSFSIATTTFRSSKEFQDDSFTWAGERTEAIEATGGQRLDDGGKRATVLFPTGKKKEKKKPDIATTTTITTTKCGGLHSMCAALPGREEREKKIT